MPSAETRVLRELRLQLEITAIQVDLGRCVAQMAYHALLRLPPSNHVRCSSQSTYARLRDYIAATTGRSAEDVQNEFEERAANEIDS